jgi:hypothetical protein
MATRKLENGGLRNKRMIESSTTNGGIKCILLRGEGRGGAWIDKIELVRKWLDIEEEREGVREWRNVKKKC